MKELAVLIPVFNGGALLHGSVESCARSGMPADRYALIVVDNCSTDGSIDTLPPADGNNVPIQIWRNERNLGRTGNWNRALEIAEAQGFQFATFLFVGDTWAPRASIGDLLNLMKSSGAVFGMAPLLIVQEDGKRCREGARISIPEETAVVESRNLLEHVVRVGRLPFAPLQANVYRLFPEDPLRFDTDPQFALNTDIESTVTYLGKHSGKVALISKPFLAWREHSQRFFVTQDPWFVMVETRASLIRISQATGLAIDWASANAISLLTSARELSSRQSLRRRLAFLWRVFRYLRTAPGSIKLGKFLAFTLNKLLWNKSYLTLPAGSCAFPATPGSTPSGSAAAMTRCGP